MVEAATLDTHRMFKRLVGTGMPEPQAEVVVDLIRERQEQLVSRDVLRYELASVGERVGKRVDTLDRDLSARIDALERDLSGQIQAVERGLSARIDELEKRMDRLEVRLDTLGKDLTVRLGGIVVAGIGAVAAAAAIL